MLMGATFAVVSRARDATRFRLSSESYSALKMFSGRINFRWNFANLVVPKAVVLHPICGDFNTAKVFLGSVPKRWISWCILVPIAGLVLSRISRQLNS